MRKTYLGVSVLSLLLLSVLSLLLLSLQQGSRMRI